MQVCKRADGYVTTASSLCAAQALGVPVTSGATCPVRRAPTGPSFRWVTPTQCSPKVHKRCPGRSCTPSPLGPWRLPLGTKYPTEGRATNAKLAPIARCWEVLEHLADAHRFSFNALLMLKSAEIMHKPEGGSHVAMMDTDSHNMNTMRRITSGGKDRLK